MAEEFDIEQYFARQNAIHGFGTQSLKSLLESRVAVVGCGGVGSAAAEYLARSGVGHMKLIDQDVVDPTNLHRIHCAGIEDTYQPKAEAIKKRLETDHPWLDIEAIVETVRSANADQILDGVDLFVDGLDSFRTRYSLNSFATRTRTPYLFASAIGNQAHAALLNPPETACLECAFPSATPLVSESCETLGITAPTVGLIGAIAADVAVKHLSGIQSGLLGNLLTVDLGGPDFLVSPLAKRKDCSACSSTGSENTEAPEARGEIMALCGDKTFAFTPPNKEERRFDLLTASREIKGSWRILSASSKVLTFQEENIVFSIFDSGRILIRGISSEREASAYAVKVWKEIALKLSA